MKRYLITAILLFTIWVGAKAQTDDPYHGGSADGHSMSELINLYFSTPTSFQPYNGGNGDGYDGDEMLNLYFNGPIAFQPYHGGDGDGYDGDEMLNLYFDNPVAFQPFKGGNGDGYDMDEPFTNQQLPFPTQFTAYLGGASDGWTGYLIPNVAILPITLLSFEGKSTDKGNLLEWKVAMEKDINGYDLQKSADGKNYNKIHSVAVKGNSSSEKNYDHLDENPFSGANYYRLEIHELSGENSYSNVVLLITEKGEQSLVLYPNPANDIIMVQYQLKQEAMMRITDLKGSIVMDKHLKAGTNTISVPVSALAQGMYLMQVSSGNNFNKSIRFVKQ